MSCFHCDGTGILEGTRICYHCQTSQGIDIERCTHGVDRQMDRCFGCENEHLRATIQTLTQERDAAYNEGVEAASKEVDGWAVAFDGEITGPFGISIAKAIRKLKR